MCVCGCVDVEGSVGDCHAFRPAVYLNPPPLPILPCWPCRHRHVCRHLPGLSPPGLHTGLCRSLDLPHPLLLPGRQCGPDVRERLLPHLCLQQLHPGRSPGLVRHRVAAVLRAGEAGWRVGGRASRAPRCRVSFTWYLDTWCIINRCRVPAASLHLVNRQQDVHASYRIYFAVSLCSRQAGRSRACLSRRAGSGCVCPYCYLPSCPCYCRCR